MTREEAVERLCTIYQSQFDINRCSAEQTPLAVTMDFYALSDKYVLSKKAKLWEAKSFEYVYLFNVPHLTREIYEACEKIDFEGKTLRHDIGLRALRGRDAWDA